MNKTLILDAMGVLYKARDDEAELLIPFIAAKNGVNDTHLIKDIYMQASRGEISAEGFWLSMGVDPGLEDEYLEGHRLTDGLLKFLEEAKPLCNSIMCLSNDVSEWSLKLRRKFGLEDFISEWFISGDLHLRKPSLEIYQHIISATNLDPSELVFVDDNPKNLPPAQTLGISCVLFNSDAKQEDYKFPVARTIQDIIPALS